MFVDRQSRPPKVVFVVGGRGFNEMTGSEDDDTWTLRGTRNGSRRNCRRAIIVSRASASTCGRDEQEHEAAIALTLSNNLSQAWTLDVRVCSQPKLIMSFATHNLSRSVGLSPAAVATAP